MPLAGRLRWRSTSGCPCRRQESSRAPQQTQCPSARATRQAAPRGQAVDDAIDPAEVDRVCVVRTGSDVREASARYPVYSPTPCCSRSQPPPAGRGQVHGSCRCARTKCRRVFAGRVRVRTHRDGRIGSRLRVVADRRLARVGRQLADPDCRHVLRGGGRVRAVSGCAVGAGGRARRLVPVTSTLDTDAQAAVLTL